MTNDAVGHDDNELIRRLLRVPGVSREELELRPTNDDDDDDDDVLHVKTLVWRLDDDRLLVTATAADERVDEARLAEVTSSSRTPVLASTEDAERATGFASGTMPPICLADGSVPVCLDRSVTGSTRSLVSVGSGAAGTDLVMPLSVFARAAEANERGATRASFARRTSDAKTTPTPPPTTTTRRRTPPKDRLAEYRSASSTLARAKLLRTTARKKGRHEDVRALVTEALANDEFHDVVRVSPVEGLDKNALHLAAWRGDLETVRLLVETSRTLDLDLANEISRGVGNLGKTPVFFALTQCREDVVRYLVDEADANLLLVNNKGQTPCSIASTHLEDEARDWLYAAEARQLREGGRFVDHRATSSDGKRYGDLDPRFPIDDANAGEDLTAGLEEYRRSIAGTPEGQIPTTFAPRSLRPTTRWWKRTSNGVRNGEQITFTNPRPTSPRQREPTTTTTTKTTKTRTSSPNSTTNAPNIDYDSLAPLTVRDVTSLPPLLVNDADTIRALGDEIDATVREVSRRRDEDDDDRALLSTAWGIDCEWRPDRDARAMSPVAILQLASRRRAFVIDLGVLSSDDDDDAAVLHARLRTLFADPRIVLVGHGVASDLGRLAGSFPRLDGLARYDAVVDLPAAMRDAGPCAASPSGLRRATAILLGRRLSKTEQCSDWSARPLTTAQFEYAALDAAVLPVLLERALSLGDEEEKNKDDERRSPPVARRARRFLAARRSSFRYVPVQKVENRDGLHVVVDDDDENAVPKTYAVPHGSLKRSVGERWFARQCWPTGTKTPDLPRLVPCPQRRPRSKDSNKEGTAPTENGRREKVKRPKPVKLLSLDAALDDLPRPGVVAGYTKDDCVLAVVGDRALPRGARLGFNRRGGVVETANAWIVFCNFGGRVYHDGGVGFVDRGRRLSFRVSPRHLRNARSGESTLLRWASSSSSSSSGPPRTTRRVLLFARESSRTRYVYCGACSCAGWAERRWDEAGRDQAYDLHLDLLEYEALTGPNRVGSEFSDLLESRDKIMLSSSSSFHQ